MKKLLIIILLLIPFTVQAWFADRMRDAFNWAKKANATRHRDQAMVRDWKATNLWQKYETLKEQKQVDNSWVEKMQEIDEFAKLDHKDIGFNLDNLPEYVSIVWCYRDWVIKKPKSDQWWGCYLPWWWWHNIMLPPQSHIVTWRKYYNDSQIINRLALVNFESSFNEDASNKFAHWYVQTLRTHWVSKDMATQLEWMRNREKRYSDNGKYCGKYWKQNNKVDWYDKWADAVLACLYRYHNHANRTWYSKRWMTVTRYYRSIFRT